MNTESSMVIFKTDDNQIAVDVRFYDESVWLTLDQMASLFERDKSNGYRRGGDFGGVACYGTLVLGKGQRKSTERSLVRADGKDVGF